jgi:hypothetical protein
VDSAGCPFDNLIFRTDGEAALVDGTSPPYGPVLMDVVFVPPSIAGEGGPPHEGQALYEQESATTFAEHQARVLGDPLFQVCRAIDGCRLSNCIHA